MASACVNNIGMSPENLINCSPTTNCQSYGWLSPRISFSRELSDEETSKSNVNKSQSEKSDPEINGLDFVDFEFPLEDPVMMLAADELFSDGKLVPLKLSTIRESMTSLPASSDVRFSPKIHRRNNEISAMDPYLFSPKAPSCSMIRWKEILRLKKLYQNRNNAKQQHEDHKTTSSSSLSSLNNDTTTTTTTTNRNAARSLRNILRRSSKSSLNASSSSIDSSSQNLPLLNDLDNESSVSISSRLSLSSSSSGHEHDDLPRLSLDSTTDKPNTIVTRNSTHQNYTTRVRAAKHRSARPSESTAPAINVSAESPRMNSSGKIVFHSLERSSSSPSTFNSGPRYKHRGIERSYSANVRFTPVLNVPVCSNVFGRNLFSSQQKKDNGVSNSTVNGGNRSTLQNHIKNRMDRT